MNWFMKDWGKAQMEGSNSMKYFLGIDSVSVEVENALAKI